MPRVVPQALKSLHTIKLQPEKTSSKIEAILCMDVAGRKGKEIAQELGMCESRISIIRNSPLYMNRLQALRGDVESNFVQKRSDVLAAGDPVEDALRDAAIDAANKKIELMRSSNEFVSSAAAGDILDRAGYRSYTEKTKVTVEVTEKMANRWEKALNYEPNHDDGGTKIRITQEVS